MDKLQSSEIGTARSAAIDRLLDHQRELEGDPDLGVDDVHERYGDALKSVANQDDLAEVIIGLHAIQMRDFMGEPRVFQITPQQTAQFLKCSTPHEALCRLERLAQWLKSVNVQNHDGVWLTPVLIKYLAAPGDFEERLRELEHLRARTRAGRYDLSNHVQRDLEYRRFASEHSFTYDVPGRPHEQLAAFHALEELPPPEYKPFSLTGQHLKEVKRIAYEAAAFLEFLQELRAQTDRPVAVVGNDRYGRQWVVEPLEPWLKGDFVVRYFRSPSHKSYRLAVRHEFEEHMRLGFTRDFIQEIDELSPHVVIADSCFPVGVGRRYEAMMMSRGARDYVNWFMVFNDIRADRDGSLYEEDSSLPLEQFPEMRKWHEFVRVSRLIEPWVSPGPTYKVAHWAPVKKEMVRLGDYDVPRRDPDPSDGRPMVIICNPALYLEDSELPADLRGTSPYYFDGPEKFVLEEVKLGFGPYGLETRITGATTGEFIEAVQQEMRKEIARLVGPPPSRSSFVQPGVQPGR